MPDFMSDGIRLHYEVGGPDAGFPTLLVHGFCSNFQLNWVGSRWVDTMARAGRRIIGLDNRGHGHSDKPHDPAAYGPQMVTDIVNLLDHLELPEVDYVGYSMGSQIGIRVVLQHPDRVRRAVLAGIGNNVTQPWKHAEAVARRLRGDLTEESPAALMFYNFARAVPNNDLEALACCITGPADPLSTADLGSIRRPVLIAVGGADPIARQASALAQQIPRAEYFEVAGRDHTTAVPSRAMKERAVQFLEEPPT